MAGPEVEVVVVGAGLSGVGAGCHFQMSRPGMNYVVLEGRERIGGTWDLFRYPGVRSDSDMFTLGYSFKPWLAPIAIADGRDILAYVEEAAREHDVVSHIRALFKQDLGPRNYAAFQSVITDARNIMAEDAIRRRVQVEIDVENNLPLVAFDRVQIQQVLINLMRNGMEAMDSAADDRILGVRVRQTDGVVRTEISDGGSGIEFPDKIFEAFFTTKEDGLGMGLAICRSIVESHGGRLWAEKNEPHGARFIFTLPIEGKAAL